MKKLKLKTKIEFSFENLEIPDFNIEFKRKEKRKKYITEIKRKKKIIDPSTKLF
jgi:hypothetical protein